MIEYRPSLRELITKVNLKTVSEIINDFYTISESDKEKTFLFYSRFRDDLLSRKVNDTKEKTPVVIEFCSKEEEIHGDRDWFSVLCKNPNFIENPKDNLRAWGGKNEEKNDCPEGCYNVNWDGYQEFYCISGIDLQDDLDCPVYFLNDITLEKLKTEEEVVAHILWEFTFYGFTEKSVNEFWDETKRRIEEVDEEGYKEFDLDELKERLNKTIEDSENKK